MLTAVDSLQLVFCASTVTAAVRAGWCTTTTPAVVKTSVPPLLLPVSALRAVAWA